MFALQVGAWKVGVAVERRSAVLLLEQTYACVAHAAASVAIGLGRIFAVVDVEIKWDLPTTFVLMNERLLFQTGS